VSSTSIRTYINNSGFMWCYKWRWSEAERYLRLLVCSKYVSLYHRTYLSTSRDCSFRRSSLWNLHACVFSWTVVGTGKR
jgi:hypothetical protein